MRLYACSDALRAQALDMRPPIEQDRVDRDFAIIDSQLDRAAREAVRVKGRELTMEQAIAEVFQLRSFL